MMMVAPPLSAFFAVIVESFFSSARANFSFFVRLLLIFFIAVDFPLIVYFFGYHLLERIQHAILYRRIEFALRT